MKSEKKEQLREEILDAVIKCKRENGGGFIKLTQVAALVGISDRTLNRYFPDKEELIYEAAGKSLRNRGRALIEKYNAQNKNGLNGRERFLLLVKTEVDRMREDPNYALMFVSAYTTCLYTSVCKKIQNFSFDEEVRQVVTVTVEEGIKDGSIRNDVTPLDTYLLTSSNFNGLAQRLIYLYSVDQPKTEQREEILHVFDHYITMMDEYLKP